MNQKRFSMTHTDLPHTLSYDYSGTCVHGVNGVELVADASRTLFWPAMDTLLVADLHLEKGSSFARHGQFLPPYDSRTTLKRLSVSIDKWRPGRVIALGDSFHDATASARLDNHSVDMLKALMHGREWIWISGNHDPAPPIEFGGRVLDYLVDGGLTLRHEPQVIVTKGEISGHLHPKACLSRRGRMVRRACFAASRNRIILPSFGAYTGGLNVLDHAFSSLFGDQKFFALMCGDNQVYKIPASDLR